MEAVDVLVAVVVAVGVVVVLVVGILAADDNDAVLMTAPHAAHWININTTKIWMCLA